MNRLKRLEKVRKYLV